MQTPTWWQEEHINGQQGKEGTKDEDADLKQQRDLEEKGWNVIAKWEVRQLIMVQGSWISASVYLFVYLCMCNTQECKKYLIQCAGVLTKQTSSLQYQTWTAIYITRFCGTKWLWVSRLHDEYTYQAVNTYTGHYALSIVTLTARAHTTHTQLS